MPGHFFFACHTVSVVFTPHFFANSFFATTTPTRKENPYSSTAKVLRYNEILVPRLEEMGVKINDLFTTVAADIPRYIREDDLIHLTDEAIEVCARQVADAIKSV